MPDKKPLSDAQLLANRENARKSTGPRSIDGKLRSRNNSFKHGLTGAKALLPSDDRDAYELYVDGIVDSLHPGSPLEYEICRDVADAHWRLRRITSVESKMLTLPAEVPPPPKPEKSFDPFGDPYRKVPDPAVVIEIDEAPFPRREDDLHTAARVCLDRPNALTNIALYEQRIQRGIKNSMEELRRLQAEREARARQDMQAAIDRYRERRMHNLPLDLVEDGFVFSVEEIQAAMRVQRREEEVKMAKDCKFDLVEYEKKHPKRAA